MAHKIYLLYTFFVSRRIIPLGKNPCTKKAWCQVG